LISRRTLRSALEPFSIAAFRSVWLGALSGNSGRFAVILVAGWEAFREGHHSAIWPSLVSMLILLPIAVFGLPAGGLADRVNRATQAAVGQAVAAVATAGAAVCIFMHVASLATTLSAAALVGVANAIQGPAWQALIPTIVGKERMVSAALSTRIAQQGSELVGPAIGTAILTTVGPGWTFLACSLFYAVGVAMMARVRGQVRPAPRVARTTMWHEVRAGVSYLRTTAPLGLLFVWVTLHCCLTMATFGILPTVATVNFGGAAGAYGLLLTAFGAGSILGPLLVMGFSNRARPGSLLWITGVLSGAPLIVVGLSHLEWLSVAMECLAGVGQAVFMAVIYASVQTCAKDAVRGRVASIQLTSTTGAMGLASIAWGALVGVASVGFVLAVPSALFVLVCLLLTKRASGLNRAVARHAGPVLPTLADHAPSVA
jgi:MFS family permease